MKDRNIHTKPLKSAVKPGKLVYVKRSEGEWSEAIVLYQPSSEWTIVYLGVSSGTVVTRGALDKINDILQETVLTQRQKIQRLTSCRLSSMERGFALQNSQKTSVEQPKCLVQVKIVKSVGIRIKCSPAEATPLDTDQDLINL